MAHGDSLFLTVFSMCIICHLIKEFAVFFISSDEKFVEFLIYKKMMLSFPNLYENHLFFDLLNSKGCS